MMWGTGIRINGIAVVIIVIIRKHPADAVVQQPAMQSTVCRARVPVGKRRRMRKEKNKDTHEIYKTIQVGTD